MYVNRDVESFLVPCESNLLDALKKLSTGMTKILFVVDNGNAVVGSLTDGDVRRHLTDISQNLYANVGDAANKNYQYIYDYQPLSYGYNLLSSKICYVPILSREKSLLGVINSNEPIIQIGDRKIGGGEPSFIIAEVGNNHNGSLELAKELVDLAIEAGADCVKFQMRNMSSIYCDYNDDAHDLGSQYVLDLLKRFQLSNDGFYELFEYCEKKNILFLCTPFDEKSVDVLEDIGVVGYKIASADLNNHSLIKYLASKKKPIILSTGMSTEKEIMSTVDLLESLSATFALLHCNSTYPTPFGDVNLSYIARLKVLGRTVIGYSGHERGYSIPIASIPLGARIIEKHFTVDKKMEGNDHKVSLLPEEFANMVSSIRSVEEALGSATFSKVITQGEMMNREVLGKSIVAKVSIKAGEKITEDKVLIRSPGQGLPPYKLPELLNRTAVRDICLGAPFHQTDIDGKVVKAKKFNLPLKYGVPVRYHDFDSLCVDSGLEMVEFHLSYRDLELDVTKYLSGFYDMDVVFHAPELFENDHVLDLCSVDLNYRNKSIENLRRVVDVALVAKSYFRNKKDNVKIVVNCGGFSSDGFLTKNERQQRYTLVAESLDKLNVSGVEFIPQTMPPFPWHFGGQQYHNLFVRKDEIVSFCDTYDYRICFDLSHTALACNYFEWDLYQFTKDIAKYSIHHHISDAKGKDGEGLNIGDGDIEFTEIFESLLKASPSSTWIPEVWQGHKNGGEGFWAALGRLELILGGK